MDELARSTLQQHITDGQAAYQAGNYPAAAEAFRSASRGYEAAGDKLSAAEMANNQSVALLKAGDAQGAWTAVEATDAVFAKTGDTRRQAIALGNQAAALEALGRVEAAIARYEQSADLLKAAGEPELRNITLQSLSALQLRKHHQFEAMATMQAALSEKKTLTAKESLLKRLIRLTFQLLNRPPSV